MKPQPFDYAQPRSVDEAVALLAGTDARILAGGQTLMAMLNLRLTAPKLLIDISRLPELRQIREEAGQVVVGAAVTQAELLAWPRLHETLPFIAAALPWVGHFQTRNRGTVCGSIAHSDPSSELPLALALLGGTVTLRSAGGSRRLGAAEFQTGLLQTARRNDEMITEVRFPAAAPGTRVRFREVARRHGDFALLALGLVLPPDGPLRIGISGMTDTAHVATLPPGLAGDSLAEWVNAKAWELHGGDDLHASARYRRDLLRRLLPPLIEEATTCAA